MSNVMMGDSNVSTHAINELGIPVFCNGLKGVVVAVSSDGMMVCDKQDSEKTKDYVGKFATRPMYEESQWRTYRVLNDSPAKEVCIHLQRALPLTQERTSPIIFTITVLRFRHSLRVKAYVYSIA